MEYTLISGASSGLGRELAVYLSQTRNIIINGRNLQRLEETKALCSKNNDVIVWQYDLSRYSTLEADFSEWKKLADIAIDGFVHCAGKLEMLPCRSITYEKLNASFAVNVYAPALLVKMLTSRRINQKHLKSVVFISSNISNRGAAAFGIYGTSKAALDGLMRNLAVELAPDVRLNSVLPGGMVTEMTDSVFDGEEYKKKFAAAYPLGIGTPQKVAPMIEFLLSDKAEWITGQQFTVDGGRTVDITERRN